MQSARRSGGRERTSSPECEVRRQRGRTKQATRAPHTAMQHTGATRRRRAAHRTDPCVTLNGGHTVGYLGLVYRHVTVSGHTHHSQRPHTAASRDTRQRTWRVGFVSVSVWAQTLYSLVVVAPSCTSKLSSAPAPLHAFVARRTRPCGLRGGAGGGARRRAVLQRQQRQTLWHVRVRGVLPTGQRRSLAWRVLFLGMHSDRQRPSTTECE